MAYTKVNWKDYPNEDTPISATNLNKMDTQIASNDARLTTLEAKIDALFTLDDNNNLHINV